MQLITRDLSPMCLQLLRALMVKLTADVATGTWAPDWEDITKAPVWDNALGFGG